MHFGQFSDKEYDQPLKYKAKRLLNKYFNNLLVGH